MKVQNCKEVYSYGALGEYQLAAAVEETTENHVIDFEQYFLQSKPFSLPKYPVQRACIDVKVIGSYLNADIKVLPGSWTSVGPIPRIDCDFSLIHGDPVFHDAARIVYYVRYAKTSGFTSRQQAVEGLITFPGAFFWPIVGTDYQYSCTLDTLKEGYYLDQKGGQHYFRDDPDYQENYSIAYRLSVEHEMPMIPSKIPVSPKYTIKEIKAYCYDLCDKFFLHPSLLDERYAEVRDYLCLKAIDNVKNLSVNYLEFWKDVPSFGAELRTLPKDLQKTFSDANIHEVADMISGETLQLTYGTNLSLNDLEAWQSTMRDFMWELTTDTIRKTSAFYKYDILSPDYRLENGNATQAYAIYYDPCLREERSTVKGLMDRFSLTPTATRVWNLIPFSFVVDWSNHIDQLLLATDAQNVVRELSVYLESIGTKYYYSLKEFPGLLLTYYRRQIQPGRLTACPAPLDSQVLNAIGEYHTNGHYVEAGALLWQLSSRRGLH